MFRGEDGDEGVSGRVPGGRGGAEEKARGVVVASGEADEQGGGVASSGACAESLLCLLARGGRRQGGGGGLGLPARPPGRFGPGGLTGNFLLSLCLLFLFCFSFI